MKKEGNYIIIGVDGKDLVYLKLRNKKSLNLIVDKLLSGGVKADVFYFKDSDLESNS